MKNETYTFSIRLPIYLKEPLQRLSKQENKSINTILNNSTKSTLNTKLGDISCQKK